jgi:N-glycosylase/DNA lyase
VTVSHILSDRNAYIRFHNTKALNVIRAQERFPEVLQHLTDGLTSRELRRWLVLNVRGLGWKEASHFLRNIGHRELAILDRHILRNLHRHRVIRSLHATLTPSRYLAIEQRFGRFAKAIGSSLDELDLFFWSRETGEILK